MSLLIDLPEGSIRVKAGDLEKIGAGGEGSVYLLRVQSKTFAVKRYHDPTPERIEKLEAAIAARPSNAIFGEGEAAVVQMAWPLGLVKEKGVPLGFVMPYVDSLKAMELDYFISPVLSKDARHLERPNIALRLQIALNLCSVINSLHEVGHHFIDFKPQNIKVYPRSRHICLIDCDSFSVSHNGRRYPASAYSPQFINPIALVNDKPPSELGEDQDNWAIAVALFMLFNYDLHPYDGKASKSVTATAIDDFVRMGLYAYGSTPHTLVAPKASSVHSLWPTELRILFDRAFYDPQKAPTMGEWVQYFQGALQNKQIARCDSMPNAVDHLKFLGYGCMQCAFESRQKRRVTKPPLAKTKSVAPPASPQIGSINPPLKPSVPAHTPPTGKSKMSGEAKAFWGLVIFCSIVFLLNYTEDSARTPVSSPQSYSFTAAQTSSAPQQFYFFNYVLRKPSELTTELDSVEELRWCMYERYRLEYLLKTMPPEILSSSMENWRLACLAKNYSEDTYNAIRDNELAKPDLRRALERATDLR